MMLNKLNKDFLKILSELSSKIFPDVKDEIVEKPKIRLVDEIKQAHREWLQAQRFFQCVSDPELIDFAIFTEEAARRKYIYLLNKAKSQGISVEESK